jgi:hypothetical protein
MMWVVPALLVGLLVVFGLAAFSIISGQQASERAAQATATAEKQAANIQATRTAVAKNRAQQAKATASAEAVVAINATSTANAVLIEENARSTAEAQATQTAVAARGAHIEKIDVEHNVYNDDGIKGMEINVHFTTDYLKDVDLQLNVYFSWPQDGTKIVSMDGTYETPDHQVAVRKDAKPGYDLARYDDFKIFMPYPELEMDFKADTFDIQFQVVIYDDKLVELARSEYVPFTYTSPGPPAGPTAPTIP